MLNKVAIINLCFLITHQVDAAYWHEWEMFHIPGGIQFFDVFNFVAFALLLACFLALATRNRYGYRGSFVIAAVSGIVLPIHAGFAIAGFTQFDLPVSIAAIVGTFVFSLWQSALTLQAKNEFEQR